jgi:hypothetical protein
MILLAGESYVTVGVVDGTEPQLQAMAHDALGIYDLKKN